MRKLKELTDYIVEKTGTQKEKIYAFGLSILIMIFITFDRSYFHGWMSILFMLLVSLLAISLFTFAIFIVGFTVIKALFFVGAEISLLIFLAQSYCQNVLSPAPSDKALQSLLMIGLVYIAYGFFKELFTSLNQKRQSLDQNGKHLKRKEKWFVIIFFIFFTSMFVWTIYQVSYPIISKLCVYNR